MTNHEPKHPTADMAGLDDLIWRIKERMPIDHTEMLALAARVKVLEEALQSVTPAPYFGESEQSKAWWAKARAALKGVDTV